MLGDADAAPVTPATFHSMCMMIPLLKRLSWQAAAAAQAMPRSAR
jgi:hypothetical protein